MMKTYILSILFAFSTTAQAHQLFSIDRNYQVHLTSEVQKTLENQRPGLKILPYEEFSSDVRSLFIDENAESPIAFEADFNGDGGLDLVSMVADEKYVYVLVFLKQKDSYKILEVKKWKRNKELGTEQTYVTRLPAKDVNAKKGSKRKPNDVIQVESYLGLVKPYFIKGYKLIEYKGTVW